MSNIRKIQTEEMIMGNNNSFLKILFKNIKGFDTFKANVRENLKLVKSSTSDSGLNRIFQKAFDLTGIHTSKHSEIFTIGKKTLYSFLNASIDEQYKFFEKHEAAGFGYTYDARFVIISALLLNLLKGKDMFDFSEAQKLSGEHGEWFNSEWLRYSPSFKLPRIDKIIERLKRERVSLCDIGSSCKKEGSPTLNILKSILFPIFRAKRLMLHGIDQVRAEYWDIEKKRFVDNSAYRRIGDEYVNNGITFHDYTRDSRWNLEKNALPESFDIITCSMVYPRKGQSVIEIPEDPCQSLICRFSNDKLILYEKDQISLPIIENEKGGKEEFYLAGEEGHFLNNLLLSLKDGGILILTPFGFENEMAHRNNCDVYWIIQRKESKFVIWDMILPFQCDPLSKYGIGDAVGTVKRMPDRQIDNLYTMMSKKDNDTFFRISQKLHFLKYIDVPHNERLGGSQFRGYAEALLLVLNEHKKTGDIIPLLWLIIREFMSQDQMLRIYKKDGLSGIEKAVDRILAERGFKDFDKVIFSET